MIRPGRLSGDWITFKSVATAELEYRRLISVSQIKTIILEEKEHGG